MKLYTEEQVRSAIQLARHTYKDSVAIIDNLTPIELPTQKELDEILFDQSDEVAYGYIRAIEWIEEQIQGGNK